MTAGIAWVLVTACCAATANGERPNIVVILADDVSPEMFGAYGNKEARTPHLDRVAEEGVMFRTAWASALCFPSRAAIMTGCYATRTGAWSNGFSIPQRDGSNDLFKRFPSFARLLKEAGYATAVAGKWHVGGAEHPSDPIVGPIGPSRCVRRVAVRPDRRPPVGASLARYDTTRPTPSSCAACHSSCVCIVAKTSAIPDGHNQ